MDKIYFKSPTRVDLAGGTLDMWPLYNFVSGARTINVAIDVYTEAWIDPLEGEKIQWISEDLNFTKEFSNLSELLLSTDPSVTFLRATVQAMNLPKKGFKLRTKSQSPVGGGLGGSSSLLMSCMKALSVFRGQKFKSVNQMVDIGHHIEAEVLRTPTGKQDYYPAVTGGIVILSSKSSGLDFEVISKIPDELEEHFLLVYTGKSHHSGINNFEVLKKAIEKDARTLAALSRIKEISEATIQAVQTDKLTALPELFNQEYKARVDLAESFSSPEIATLAEITLRFGAKSIKICGAGGGGCVLVWVNPAERKQVVTQCQNAGFQVMSSRPVPPLKDLSMFIDT